METLNLGLVQPAFHSTLAGAMKGQERMIDGFLVATSCFVRGDLKYEVGKTRSVMGLDDQHLMVKLHIDCEAVGRSIAVPEQESISHSLLAKFGLQALTVKHLHIGSSFQVAEADIAGRGYVSLKTAVASLEFAALDRVEMKSVEVELAEKSDVLFDPCYLMDEVYWMVILRRRYPCHAKL